ncbi:MAG: flagellar export protein FliJ [Acetivibrionales bacterium]|jgi:flagellar FliJ protein|nr:flagellar export protein FliJ [Bacillota bacterium]NLP08468.1 flagellar export protein FliJ [Clostridiaceae bacterium]HOA55435.1 flagellar export protein FliJ [Clostridiales bacterium]HPZ05143.1 flagellar export protein FliJ [Clostridiales bacterium]HQD31295.1 flagellar export protein FliJ [Clostridiales bacterium]
MAKFIFKLQSVLNLRKQKEDNIKNELGIAIQRLEQEKRRLSELENTLDATVREFNEKTRKTTVHELIEYNEYLSLLNSRIKSQKDNVNNAAQYVDKVREELVKAVKDRKILEKLKERHYEEFLLEQKKLEQKTNDEIVSYNYNESSAGD